MVAFLRFVVATILISSFVGISAIASFSHAEGRALEAAIGPSDRLNMRADADADWLTSTKHAQDAKSFDGAEAEPSPVAMHTQEPDMLPESGAAASLWPIFIALFIVAGYLAYDSYRSDKLVK